MTQSIFVLRRAVSVTGSSSRKSGAALKSEAPLSRTAVGPQPPTIETAPSFLRRFNRFENIIVGDGISLLRWRSGGFPARTICAFPIRAVTNFPAIAL
jgi:hypothetical protein